MASSSNGLPKLSEGSDLCNVKSQKCYDLDENVNSIVEDGRHLPIAERMEIPMLEAPTTLEYTSELEERLITQLPEYHRPASPGESSGKRDTGNLDWRAGEKTPLKHAEDSDAQEAVSRAARDAILKKARRAHGPLPPGWDQIINSANRVVFLYEGQTFRHHPLSPSFTFDYPNVIVQPPFDPPMSSPYPIPGFSWPAPKPISAGQFNWCLLESSSNWTTLREALVLSGVSNEDAQTACHDAFESEMTGGFKTPPWAAHSPFGYFNPADCYAFHPAVNEVAMAETAERLGRSLVIYQQTYTELDTVRKPCLGPVRAR